MSERIEPNCLAAVVTKSMIPFTGPVVHVIKAATPEEVFQRMSKATGLSGLLCDFLMARYIRAYGLDHHWWCESEESWHTGILHEIDLRRLPPPGIETLITIKDTSVPA